MKLLFVTQVVDKNDNVLGTYHEWIRKLAPNFEQIEVICLFEGKHILPSNVTVHSLGKEKGRVSRYIYALRFLKKVWVLRKEYDVVFVHMNQEYLLLAGLLWKLLRKRLYLWRNHYSGTILTDIAALFCTKVFCTSRYSYTAKYKKTEFMPVGVDTERFAPDARIERKPGSILFLARMAPSKRPTLLIEALNILNKKGIAFTATFVGSPIPEHDAYYRSLVERAETYGLTERVVFRAGVPNREAVDQYRAHEIFVNCSPSGMFDKTIFEAAASGCLVLTSSNDFRRLAGEGAWFDDSVESLAEQIAELLSSREKAKTLRNRLPTLVTENSLSLLSTVLAAELHGRTRVPLIKRWAWHLLSALARLIPRHPRMTVLLYHSISTDVTDRFAVSPAAFEKQLRYLHERFDIVPLSRAFGHASGDRVTRDSIAITFDDGYSDFITDALPLLRRYGVPATVFLLGGQPDRRELGNDHPLIEEDQFEAFANTQVEVGSHAVTHRKLTKISEEETRTELSKSRTAIATNFGATPRYFAYPKGSYNARIVQLAREAGYEGAVTVVERSVRTDDDLYMLPRIQIDGTTSPQIFAAKMTPASDWYYTLWRRFRSA